MILIGSRAFVLRSPQTINRAPVDFDFVCTLSEYKIWMEENAMKVRPTKVYELPEYNKWIVEGSTNCEFEIITPDKSSELLDKLVKDDSETIETPFGLIPSLNILLAIKETHKFKKFETPKGCANWYKHAINWHILTKIGAVIKPEYKEFIALREKETYTYSHPKLNMSKKDFFDDKNGITQIYDHDDIHKAVAINDKPAYEYYLKEGSEVQCDMNKFFEVSEFIRLCGVCEEAMTLALERSKIAHPEVWTSEFAWKFALAKVASTITSG